MTSQPRLHVAATVLGSPDPQRLAAFHQELLVWQRRDDEARWVRLLSADGGTALSFQYDAE
jgi:hypothetical protein